MFVPKNNESEHNFVLVALKLTQNCAQVKPYNWYNPHNRDIIVRRWEEFTGKKAEHWKGEIE